MGINEAYSNDTPSLNDIKATAKRNFLGNGDLSSAKISANKAATELRAQFGRTKNITVDRLFNEQGFTVRDDGKAEIKDGIIDKTFARDHAIEKEIFKTFRPTSPPRSAANTF